MSISYREHILSAFTAVSDLFHEKFCLIKMAIAQQSETQGKANELVTNRAQKKISDTPSKFRLFFESLAYSMHILHHPRQGKCDSRNSNRFHRHCKLLGKRVTRQHAFLKLSNVYANEGRPCFQLLDSDQKRA